MSKKGSLSLQVSTLGQDSPRSLVHSHWPVVRPCRSLLGSWPYHGENSPRLLCNDLVPTSLFFTQEDNYSLHVAA